MAKQDFTKFAENGKIHRFNKTNAKENGSKGGKRSAESKAETRIIKDEILKRMGANDWDELVDNMIQRAKEDTKSFETLRDTIGQKPVEQVQATVEVPTFISNIPDED